MAFKFDLESGSKGEWFPFFGSKLKSDGSGEYEFLDPEPDSGKVKIRIADMEEVEKIHAVTRKRVSDNVFNPKTRSMERLVYVDQTPEQEKKEREMIWDYAIEDWEGILDAKGKPIPCTLENKMKLMNIPVFARFIGRCLQLLTEKGDVQNLEKN
jgi:hypothetical protein